MHQLTDFFKRLFDYSDWPPRWHCGKWTAFHGWLYIISDLLIWSAYFAIPFLIIKYITKKHDAKFIKLYFLFAAFILACGSTHLLDAVSFWFPTYRLNALMRFVTGVISWVTVFYLYKLLPIAFSLKTSQQLEHEIEERKKAEQQNKETEERFALLVNSIQGYAIFMLDTDGYVISWNEGANRIKGYTAEEIIGKHISIFYTKEEIEHNEPTYNLSMAVEHGTYESESLRVKKDGSQFWASVTLTALYNDDNQLKGFAKLTRDITERKETESSLKNFNEQLEREVAKKTKEIKESEKKYQTLVEQASDGILISNAEGYYFDANSSVAKMTGYSKEELLTMHSRDILFEDDMAKKPMQFERLLTDGQMVTERLIKKKDGTAIMVEISAKVLPNGNFMGMLRDITKRKEIETQLILQKDLSDSIIRSLPGIFYLCSKNGELLIWNENFETVSGYSRNEIRQMQLLDFFDEDEKEPLQESIAKALSEGQSETEIYILSKQKERKAHYLNSCAIVYKNEACTIGIGIDLSKQKEAEKELKTSEKKYRLLFDNNPLPMWMIDVNTLNIIDVNEAAIIHYGYSKEEFLSMNIRDIRPPEDIGKLEAAVAMPKNSLRKMGIWNHRKKDGSLIKVEITSHDINYQNQQTRLILSNDVTEKVKAEEALLKLNAELKKLYAHQQDVREEERKHIAREIHDELGQLMTGLKMDVSWLRKKIMAVQPELETKLNETIGILDESVKTIRRISADLRPAILDDLGIIEAIKWLAKDFEKRTQIKCSISSNTASIESGDEVKVVLFRIFQETLTNIIRHAEATTVSVEILAVKNNLTMQVVDNGKGYDVATQTNHLGILGMKERITNINGELYISSAIGRGTSVTIIIPV